MCTQFHKHPQCDALTPADTGRFVERVPTHDAGHKLTEADFSLAKAIDAIAKSSGATPE
jgi:pterin-4a-carbinolamine dehydratase